MSVPSEIQIDNKGRILIPKEIREKLHLNSGEKLLISVQDNEIRLKPKISPKSMINTIRVLRSEIKLITDVPLETKKLFE